MNESSFNIIMYIGGSTVSLWRGSDCVAVRSLHLGDIPASLHEREARLMLRVREIAHEYFNEMKQAAYISVVLGSPWVTYHTRMIEHTREKPFIFSRDLEEKFINEDYAVMKKEIERTHGAYNDVVIGLQIQKHILNGHTMENPFGVKAYRCTLPTIVALAQRKLAHNVLAVLEMSLQRDDIHIQSHWQLLSSSYIQQERIVCVIGSVNTDIMWLIGGVVEQVASIPCGYEKFVHYQMYNATEPSFHEQIQYTDQWSRECSQVLHQWAIHKVLPQTLEIITDSIDALDYSNLIIDEVRTLPFFTTTPHIIPPHLGRVFSDAVIIC